MHILLIGDVFGRPGRDLVRRGLPALIAQYEIDLTIANVENAAAGAGITREIGDALLSYGVDVMTTGNHVWDKREALAYIGAEPRLLRPLNMTAGVPGHGVLVSRAANGQPVAVINAMGRVFMPLVDNPFTLITAQIELVRNECRTVVVDFHAEATSEKLAMGWYLDGKVSAVVGTHTHVQTADARVLPGGTAYITDAGMTGPHDSVIGSDCQAAINRFVTGLPGRLEPAAGNPRLQGIVVSTDDRTGLALSIERIDWSLDEVNRARHAVDADARD